MTCSHTWGIGGLSSFHALSLHEGQCDLFVIEIEQNTLILIDFLDKTEKNSNYKAENHT
jgi:hypothetical protein